MISSLQVLLSGIIAGMIIFHAGVVAPALFKNLPAEQAGPFLRTAFPKLFGATFLLGCAALALSFIGNGGALSNTVFLVTIFAMAICYLIIPATNSAKDSGEEDTFKRLHSLSVILTLIVLVLNVIWIFFSLTSTGCSG